MLFCCISKFIIWNILQQTHLGIILGEPIANIDFADKISSSLNFCSNLKQDLDSKIT